MGDVRTTLNLANFLEGTFPEAFGSQYCGTVGFQAGHHAYPLALEREVATATLAARSRCVEMEIDAVLIVRMFVFEIVGQARDGREFVAGFWIEVCIAHAAVDRCVLDRHSAIIEVFARQFTAHLVPWPTGQLRPVGFLAQSASRQWR